MSLQTILIILNNGSSCTSVIKPCWHMIICSWLPQIFMADSDSHGHYCITNDAAAVIFVSIADDKTIQGCVFLREDHSGGEKPIEAVNQDAPV